MKGSLVRLLRNCFGQNRKRRGHLREPLECTGHISISANYSMARNVIIVQFGRSNGKGDFLLQIKLEGYLLAKSLDL